MGIGYVVISGLMNQIAIRTAENDIELRGDQWLFQFQVASGNAGS